MAELEAGRMRKAIHVKQILVCAVLALALAGCVSREERAARDSATCSSYGFQPGSEAFASCRMAIDQGRERDRQRLNAAGYSFIQQNNQTLQGR